MLHREPDRPLVEHPACSVRVQSRPLTSGLVLGLQGGEHAVVNRRLRSLKIALLDDPRFAAPARCRRPRAGPSCSGLANLKRRRSAEMATLLFLCFLVDVAKAALHNAESGIE